MVPTKPVLIFKSDIQRRPYFKRFSLMMLAAGAGAAAWYALELSSQRALADVLIVDIGKIAALAVMALFIIHAIVNLMRGILLKNESLHFYDRGFVWQVGKETHKYGWKKLNYFIEENRAVRLFGRPIMQFGGHELVMDDGKVFKFRNRHGDMAKFADAVDPYIGDLTGTRMGRALRAERSVQLHPELTVHPGGIQAGDHIIPWSQLDVERTHRRLVILSMENEDSDFEKVMTFNTRKVRNVSGFLELALTTIEHYRY